MTLRLGIALIAGVLGLASQGWAAAPGLDCNRATTTVEMTACAEQEWRQADAALNDIYQKLMKDARLDEDARKLLREAQRKWLPFRDAECAWSADAMRGGTGAAILAHACLAILTKDRVKQLEQAWSER